MTGYNALKNITKRVHLWYFFVIALLLADEYVKEGYLFKLSDLLKPFTHENLILIATVAYLAFLIFNSLRFIKRIIQ